MLAAFVVAIVAAVEAVAASLAVARTAAPVEPEAYCQSHSDLPQQPEARLFDFAAAVLAQVALVGLEIVTNWECKQ